MNVLVIGGTKFVGRHVTDELVRRGHAVTQFNRGITDTRQRTDIEVVHGDRTGELDRLPRTNWDAVVDMCGYTPDVVRTSLHALRSAGRYLFISSISVYEPTVPADAHVDENLPVARMPEGADTTKVGPETYGPLKALCENEVRAAFGERATILRPGLIAGPYDPTDRFTYWPLRASAGGEFLAPENSDYPLQYIDVRDVAEFVVTVLEGQRGGTFNVVTAPGSRTFGSLLDACIAQSQADAQPLWTDAAFLLEHGVAPWSDLPLWIPESEPFVRHLASSNARARSAGLATRPLVETVRATLQWATVAGKRFGDLAAGLSPERERELLKSREARTPASQTS